MCNVSLFCEPVDPETVFDPLVCEPIDPEIHLPARSLEQLLNPEHISSSEDREVQVGNEEFTRDVSLVREPVDPEIACESRVVNRSTAQISGVSLPQTRLLLTTWCPCSSTTFASLPD